MSTTASHESRQTRRWRERRAITRPTPSPRKPYVLLCRCANAQGAGFWAMTEVDTPQEGDAVARDWQAAPSHVLGEMHLRCELAPNTDEGLRSCGTASAKGRTAARRLEEVPR